MNNPFLDIEENQEIELSLSVSDSAIKRLSNIFESEANRDIFRVGVLGGGCSGFQYTFDIDENCSEQDFILEFDTFKVVCDKKSLEYINGGVVDFIDSLTGRYFTIGNPNATASCGCGTSFSV